MNNGSPRHVEVQSNPREAGGSRWFQFSLTSVFVIVTGMALILSTFFSVGRLVGMSNIEVLRQGLGPFVFALPSLLVWIVGLGMAIRRRKGNRAAAILTMIAAGGMLLTVLVCYVVQMVLTYLLTSNQPGTRSFSLAWGFTLNGVLYAVLSTICWILILLAIFAQRTPDAPQTGRADPSGGPFSLASVFVIIALMVIVLATFFTVDQSLWFSLFDLPILLVWIVGFGIAIGRWKRNRVPAILTMVALGGLMLTVFFGHVVSAVLMHLIVHGQTGNGVASWGFTFLQVLYAVLDPTFWILILLAIFAGRPPDAPATDRADPDGHAERVE
jgi:MFS family permease